MSREDCRGTDPFTQHIFTEALLCARDSLFPGSRWTRPLLSGSLHLVSSSGSTYGTLLEAEMIRWRVVGEQETHVVWSLTAQIAN